MDVDWPCLESVALDLAETLAQPLSFLCGELYIGHGPPGFPGETLTARPPPPASLTSKSWEDEELLPVTAAEWSGSLPP